MPAIESSPERRDKAIKTFNDRIEAAKRKAAEHEASLRAHEARRQKLYEDWPAIADGVIANSVGAVSEDFAQRGSPISFAPVSTAVNSGPQRQSDRAMQTHLASSPRSFDVRHKGQAQSIARLQFEIDISTGKVSATTTAKGAELPPPVLLSEFKPQWASQAAEAVLLVILEN